MAQANTYAKLEKNVAFCKREMIHNIGNYWIVVQLCKYAKTVQYPYSKEIFSSDFISDYFWISTCNKSPATKMMYRYSILNFANKFNQEIHKTGQKIELFTPKHYPCNIN